MLFSNLNSSQTAAAQYVDSHALVLAGAGSGKTTTLAARLHYLFSQGVSGKNICALTFTNKAAQELKERVGKGVADDNDLDKVWALTFHSMCFRLLQIDGEEIGLKKKWSIADSVDTKKVMTQAIKDLKLEDITAASACSLISLAKNSGENIEQYLDNQELFMLYQRYQKELEESSRLDFDDLILYAIRLFDNSVIREKWQNKFKHILVDEYQDTNPIQEKLLELLVGEQSVLWVVGDELQVLYSFRLANVQRILSFAEKWNAKTFHIQENYRSSPEIVIAANQIVKQSKERTDKILVPTKSSQGIKVELCVADDAYLEAQQIAKTMKKTSSGAILYRKHSLSRIVETALREEGVPYVIRGGLSFYARAEIKTAVAVLQLLHNPYDMISAERIMLLQPGFGQASWQKLKAWTQQVQRPILETMFAAEKVLPKKTALTAQKIAHAYAEVLHNDNYQSVLQVYQALDKSLNISLLYMKQERGEDKVENLKEFEAFLGESNQIAWKQALPELLIQSSLDPYETNKGDIDPIVLSTIHAAKGLEWNDVWVMGLEKDIFLLDPKEVEEARRLVHVAMTRAKKHLTLSFAKQRPTYTGELMYSKRIFFLEDIEDLKVYKVSNQKTSLPVVKKKTFKTAPIVDYKKGQLVIHPKFGKGVIMKDDAEQVTVVFNNQTKTLVKKYAHLKLISF